MILMIFIYTNGKNLFVRVGSTHANAILYQTRGRQIYTAKGRFPPCLISDLGHWPRSIHVLIATLSCACPIRRKAHSHEASGRLT